MNLRAILTFVTSLLAAAPALAEPVNYSFDPAHSKVWWEVRHFGTSTHRGRFDAAPQGSISIDREAGRGQVSLSVETGSVSSGVAALDTMLKSGSFLASASHPSAYFVASQFKFDAGKVAELRGEFTLRGVSRPLSLRASHFACRMDEMLKREVCGGDFEGELLRSDYGSTFGLPFVGDKVRLLVSVEGIRDQP
jgi:polyisoprenoid-binding protein YceI